MPEIKRFGDSAILVNFEQQIDQYINAQVIQLTEDLLQAVPEAIQYTIPAYCSLTVRYDPKHTSYAALASTIQQLLEQEKVPGQTQQRQILVPVCYDSTFGLDLAELSQAKEMSMAELIQHHTRPLYRVYMLGFLPGFVYMGKLPEHLQCQRKKTPRLRVPERSVAIAGFQTGIYPSEAPGGWNIIGRTPLSLMQPAATSPFLFQAGDQIRFKPINLDEYQEIEEQVRAGIHELKITYV